MAHGLADQHFRFHEEVKNWIDSWIASKDDQFFRRGIRTLPERWEKAAMDNTLNHKCITSFLQQSLKFRKKNGGSKVVHLI